MKINIFLPFLFLFIITSCNNKATQNEIIALENNEKNSIENYDEIYANAGELINDVSFELYPNDKEQKEFGNEFINWVNIKNASNEIKQLKNPDEIIINESTAKLIIDYPLKKPAIFEISNPNGFSRKDLILLINQKYEEVYQEEERTATAKTVPLEKREGLVNRNETDGIYQIWGHDLDDLDLIGIKIYKNTAGVITLIPQIES